MYAGLQRGLWFSKRMNRGSASAVQLTSLRISGKSTTSTLHFFYLAWLELQGVANQGSDAGFVRSTQQADGFVVIGGMGLGGIGGNQDLPGVL